MATPELIELWKQIEADLRRAVQTLPPEAVDDPAVSEFEDFLGHNELELACDALECYAQEHPVSRGFWLALRDASLKMELHEHAARYDRHATVG